MKISISKNLIQNTPKNNGLFGSIKEQINAYEEYEFASLLKGVNGSDNITDLEIRDKACKKIAKLSGIPESDIYTVIKSWTTSSDGPESLKLQKAASELFALVPNDHFAQKAIGIKPETHHYKIAEAIYKITQKLLASHNIKKILLYRGFNIPKIDNSLVGNKVATTSNPLSSFSNAYNVAYKFTHPSNWYFKNIDSNFPYITAAYFDADRIFSASITGPGCTDEMEFVTFGGNYSLYFDPLIYNLIEVSFREWHTKVHEFKIKNALALNSQFKPKQVLLQKDLPKVMVNLNAIATALSVSVESIVQVAKRDIKVKDISMSFSTLNIDREPINVNWIKHANRFKISVK